MRPLLRSALAILAYLLTTAGAGAAGAVSTVADEAPDASWRFRVFLDDREIGFHYFFLREDGATQKLRSVADFEYRLMFLKLYDYEHENLETWSGNCLQSVESHTDANGEPFAVRGRQDDGGFRVSGSEGQATLPGCVMSFAYWNPAFLQQERLLNTQDGTFEEVRVSPPVQESVEVRGQQQPAWRYRLEAGDLSLDLWYSLDREWLALESEVQGGRTLRYELM